MSEKEPPINLEPKKTKEGKVVWSSAPKKEVEKKPISKEAHRRQLLNQIDYCNEQITMYETKIEDIRTMIARIDTIESSGMIVRCFDEGDNLTYEAVEKPPLGFPRPLTDTKNASTWKQEMERKKAK